MSSRWPQGHQDQRSPYATYEAWPEESDGAQSWPDVSWQDSGWQDSDHGNQGQWGGSDPGGAAVEDPWGSQRQDYAGQQPYAEPDRPAATPPSSAQTDDYQQEWSQSAGGLGDDADYEWFQYLSQGRSAPSKPDPAPPPSAPRRGQREPRPRGRDKAA